MPQQNPMKSKTLPPAASGFSPAQAGSSLVALDSVYSSAVRLHCCPDRARSEVVRFFPQTASLFAAVGLPVNLRNLRFENMRISKEVQEGLSSLVVEGTIVSVTSRPSEVPRLRFAARDAAGQEVYTWTAMPSRSILGPGEKLDFRSRFVSDNAVDVMVRFVNAQDATPAAK